MVYIFVFKLLFQVTHQFSVHFDQQNQVRSQDSMIPKDTTCFRRDVWNSVVGYTLWSFFHVSISIWLQKGAMLERHVIFQQSFFRSYVNLQGWRVTVRKNSSNSQQWHRWKFLCGIHVLETRAQKIGLFLHVLSCATEIFTKSRGSIMDHPGTKAFTNLSWVILGKDPFLHSLPAVDATKSCSSWGW